MYYVSKRIEVAGAHRLILDYDSPCSNLHGHNWIITIHCKSETLNQNGMVCDFAHIKKLIHNTLDHQNINEIIPFNPTAENMARWIVEQVPNAYKCEVQESEGNVACYEI